MMGFAGIFLRFCCLGVRPARSEELEKEEQERLEKEREEEEKEEEELAPCLQKAQ